MDTSLFYQLITGNLPSISLSQMSSIGNLSNIITLSKVECPACTVINATAFGRCYALAEVSFPQCRNIGTTAFSQCLTLTNVSFPECTNIGQSAFYYCTGLISISFPKCTYIGSYAFYYCSNLLEASFSLCTIISSGVFCGCHNMRMASFNVCRNIYPQAFMYCSRLLSAYFLASSLATLSNSDAFRYCAIQTSAYLGTFGFIYVPSSLVASYKTATNWTYYSARIVGYDPSKINFTIEGVTYYAEEGMTWAEWVNSQYNVGGYYELIDMSSSGYGYTIQDSRNGKLIAMLYPIKKGLVQSNDEIIAYAGYGYNNEPI